VIDFESMLELPGDAKELHHSLQGCPYCENFCYDHYLERRWRNASFLCPEAPRSRQLLIAAGGGMTERPGAVADAGRAGKHARARAGTDLNAEVVHPWQFVDGEAHRRAARLLDWLPLWTIPFVGSFLPSAWLAKRHLWRRSEHSPPYMLLTSKAM